MPTFDYEVTAIVSSDHDLRYLSPEAAIFALNDLLPLGVTVTSLDVIRETITPDEPPLDQRILDVLTDAGFDVTLSPIAGPGVPAFVVECWDSTEPEDESSDPFADRYEYVTFGVEEEYAYSPTPASVFGTRDYGFPVGDENDSDFLA